MIAQGKERARTEPRFLPSVVCRPIPLTEGAVQLRLSRKNHGKRLSKKNLEGLYEVLAPGSNIIKVSLTTPTIKEPGKPTVTVRNSDVAEFVTLQERQTPLKVYVDRGGPQTCETLLHEQIQSHVKQCTRKLNGDKKMKRPRRESGSGVSSSRSNISRAKRGRIPIIPNFPAIRNRRNEEQAAPYSAIATASIVVSLKTSRTRSPRNAGQTCI